MRYRRNSSIDDFLGFQVEEQERTRSWQSVAMDAFRDHVRGEAPMYALAPLLREPNDTGTDGVVIADRSHGFGERAAWAILSPNVNSEAGALKLGARIFRQLVGRRNYPMSVPYVDDLPLMVGYPGGHVWVKPPQKAAPVRKGPTATDIKDEIIRKLEPVFGRKTSVIGSVDKGYAISIAPSTKQHRFKAGTSARRENLDDLLKDADDLLERAYAAGVTTRSNHRLSRLEGLKQRAADARNEFRYYARIDGVLTREERQAKHDAEKKMESLDREVERESRRIREGRK